MGNLNQRLKQIAIRIKPEADKIDWDNWNKSSDELIFEGWDEIDNVGKEKNNDSPVKELKKE